MLIPSVGMRAAEGEINGAVVALSNPHDLVRTPFEVFPAIPLPFDVPSTNLERNKLLTLQKLSHTPMRDTT
jgi:hypothetical protein